MPEDHDEKLAQEWYDKKTAMMVDVLGEALGVVVGVEHAQPHQRLRGVGVALAEQLGRFVDAAERAEAAGEAAGDDGILLVGGEQLDGVIATDPSASLTLKMAGNVTKSVLRSDVASLKSTGISLMPEGLEAAMTPQSLADLIAYLKVTR